MFCLTNQQVEEDPQIMMETIDRQGGQGLHQHHQLLLIFLCHVLPTAMLGTTHEQTTMSCPLMLPMKHPMLC